MPNIKTKNKKKLNKSFQCCILTIKKKECRKKKRRTKFFISFEKENGQKNSFIKEGQEHKWRHIVEDYYFVQ